MGRFIAGNPLYERLAHHAKPPSLRVCLWLAFGLGLATLAIMTRTVLDLSAAPGDSLSGWLVLGALALAAFSPVVTAIAAAALAAQDVQREEYKLVRLTNLSAGKIVQGYIFAALFRLRVLLALVVGTMPVVVLGLLILNIRATLVMFNLHVFDIVQESGYSGYMIGLTGPIPWRPAEVRGPLLMFLALAVGQWGVILLAAAIGTSLGLWWRRVGWGAVVAGILMVFPGPLMAIGVLDQVPMVLIPNYPFWSPPSPGAQIAAAMLALLIPYALAAGLMHLARRWV